MASQEQRQFIELQADIDGQGLSRRAFSVKADIDKSVFSRLINGKLRRMDPALIAKVSAATEGRIAGPQFSAFYVRLAKLDAAESQAA